MIRAFRKPRLKSKLREYESMRAAVLATRVN